MVQILSNGLCSGIFPIKYSVPDTYVLWTWMNC